jgi:hypothetical protein
MEALTHIGIDTDTQFALCFELRTPLCEPHASRQLRVQLSSQRS